MQGEIRDKQMASDSPYNHSGSGWQGHITRLTALPQKSHFQGEESVDRFDERKAKERQSKGWQDFVLHVACKAPENGWRD